LWNLSGSNGPSADTWLQGDILGLGSWFGLVLLTKLPAIATAATISIYAMMLMLVEQWLFILFVVGAFVALRRDARLRASALSSSKHETSP
jgi:hypothetical protein